MTQSSPSPRARGAPDRGFAPLGSGRLDQSSCNRKPPPELDFSTPSSHSDAMTALLFDTLRLSRTLRDKGHFTSEQAEALAEALGEASQGDLATKADLAGVRTEIAELKTELKSEIAELRTEIAGLRT